ncbi:hypothetical protein CSPX01_10480 [Colletotrichum filicis]|nr:hypothetical protein CSPX01_10480 [Colletotrichum filicis]
MQALVTESSAGGGGSPKMVRKQVPIPEPAPHQALVKVSHIAQNPTDVQSLDGNAFGDGAVLGCDFVGTVEAVGDKCSKLSKGDTVAGLIWGGQESLVSRHLRTSSDTSPGEIKGLGGYGEYTLADDNISFRVPKNISLQEAATIPLASMTAELALFSKACLAIPRESGSETARASACTPEDHKLGTEFYEKLPGWVEAGKLKPNKPKAISGGLDGVDKGFQVYRDGVISGEKLVYQL